MTYFTLFSILASRPLLSSFLSSFLSSLLSFPLLSSLSSLLPSVSGGMMPLASPRSTSVGLGIIAPLRAELHLRVASEWDSHRTQVQVFLLLFLLAENKGAQKPACAQENHHHRNITRTRILAHMLYNTHTHTHTHTPTHIPLYLLEVGL